MMYIHSVARQWLSFVLSGCSILALADSASMMPSPGVAPAIPQVSCDAFPPGIILQTCEAYLQADHTGVMVINNNTTADIIESEAKEGWLILVDGSEGAVETTDQFSIQNNQHIVGIIRNGSRPVLRHTSGVMPFPSHLVDFSGDHYQIRNLEFHESPGFTHSELLKSEGRGSFLVDNCLFVDKGISYEIIELKPPGCFAETMDKCDQKYQIQNSVFQVSLSSRAISVEPECRSESSGYVTLTSNTYHIVAQYAGGIVLVAGALLVRDDRFEFNATDIDVMNSFGIEFGLPHGANATRKFNSEITGSVFDGMGHSGVVGIRLRRGDSEDYSVLIARNIFREMDKAIEFSNSVGPGQNASDILAQGSICNVWMSESGNTASERCSGLPKDGFLHFTDGIICGEAPVGFNPDCSEVPADPYSLTVTSAGIMLSSLERPSATVIPARNSQDDRTNTVAIGVGSAVAGFTLVTVAVAITGVVVVRAWRMRKSSTESQPVIFGQEYDTQSGILDTSSEM